MDNELGDTAGGLLIVMLILSAVFSGWFVGNRKATMYLFRNLILRRGLVLSP